MQRRYFIASLNEVLVRTSKFRHITGVATGDTVPDMIPGSRVYPIYATVPKNDIGQLAPFVYICVALLSATIVTLSLYKGIEVAPS